LDWLICYEYEAHTLLRLVRRVSVSDTHRFPTRHRHIWLHWIMSFSQIIIGVDVSVSESCLVWRCLCPSILHSLFECHKH
jgi:hypothetical protein